MQSKIDMYNQLLIEHSGNAHTYFNDLVANLSIVNNDLMDLSRIVIGFSKESLDAKIIKRLPINTIVDDELLEQGMLGNPVSHYSQLYKKVQVPGDEYFFYELTNESGHKFDSFFNEFENKIYGYVNHAIDATNSLNLLNNELGNFNKNYDKLFLDYASLSSDEMEFFNSLIADKTTLNPREYLMLTAKLSSDLVSTVNSLDKDLVKFDPNFDCSACDKVFNVQKFYKEVTPDEVEIESLLEGGKPFDIVRVVKPGLYDKSIAFIYDKIYTPFKKLLNDDKKLQTKLMNKLETDALLAKGNEEIDKDMIKLDAIIEVHKRPSIRDSLNLKTYYVTEDGEKTVYCKDLELSPKERKVEACCKDCFTKLKDSRQENRYVPNEFIGVLFKDIMKFNRGAYEFLKSSGIKLAVPESIGLGCGYKLTLN